MATQRSILVLVALWTALVLWLAHRAYQGECWYARHQARIEARTHLLETLAFRRWVSRKGGVYVPVSDRTPPNPHLEALERDLSTPSGRRLTLMNPSYVTRELQEEFRERFGILGRLTSLRPKRPGNAALPWEAEALRELEVTRAEELFREDEVEGEAVLRFLKPLVTETSCLSCHGVDGYREGDIRGGLSVELPLRGYLGAAWQRFLSRARSLGLMWSLGFAGLLLWMLANRRWRRHDQQARRELEEKEERLRILIENVPGVVYRCANDEHWTIEFMSPDVETLTGHPPEDFLGNRVRSFASVIHPEDRDSVRSQVLERVEAGELFHLEYRLLHADGSVRHVLEQGQAVSGPGGEVRCLDGVLLDITLRQDLEERRRGLERQVLETQKLESLGVLAGGVAHDFNNLLGVILGNLELLLEDLPVESPLHERLAAIGAASHRAEELTRQMLAYTGRGQTLLEEIDLNASIQEMTKLFEVTISRKAQLDLDLAEGLPPIEGDLVQLRQIVMNLLTNASEALGPEGGQIRFATGVHPLEVEGREREHVFLRVEDSGCGMGSETRERLFEPFYTTKFKGRGLGMAAVQGVVRSHRGRIEVESEEGEGTCFTLSFPALGRPGSKPRRRPLALELSSPGAPAWQAQGLVLVVDDEASLRSVTRRRCERMGLTVLEAGDGEAGLELIRENRDQLRCVILDMTMPGLGGEDVLRCLGEEEIDVPVLLSSGHPEEDLEEVFQRFPSLVGYLQKPFDQSSLRRHLRAVFREA